MEVYVRVCACVRVYAIHLFESSDCGISWSLSVCFMNHSIGQYFR